MTLPSHLDKLFCTLWLIWWQHFMCFQTNKTPTFGGCLNLRFNLLELSISCVVRSWSDQIGRVGDCLIVPWHASVSKDYGVALWLIVLEERLVWLERPIREWQSLLHSEQMWWTDEVSLVPGFPRLSLCPSLFGKCLFKLGKALLQCLPSSWSFRIHGFPFVNVNAQELQVPLADIFTA